MRKRKQQVRVFSIFASLLMIFSLITPGLAGAEGFSKNNIAKNDTKSTSQAKISNQLLDEFDEEDKVKFLVKFNETADVKSAAQKARQKASDANLSAYRQEIAQRSAVITELKATALQSQANVKTFLEAEVEKGNVDDVHPYYIVNGMAVTATKDIAEKIATFAEVEKVLPNEMNYLYSTDTVSRDDTPNLEEVSAEEKENATNNQLQNIEWNVDRVNAPDVWSMGFDGSGIIVANMDTGVEWDHPALMDKYAGYDAATGQVDHTYSFYDPVYEEEEAYDLDSHGTHVMGTMVGSEPDGSNQVGVAPGAKWIAVQAFSQVDGGVGAYDADLIAGAEWLMEPGGDTSKAPDVVNNSWGGGPGIDEWFQDAVIAWREAGIVPVFAAGNTTLSNPGGPGSVSAPANYPESFAVGNTNSADMVSSSSLRGPSPYDEIKPDIAAPGTGIRSTVPGNGYASFNGTSMAAPHVAGIVALLKEANNDLEVDQIEEILMDTARERTDSEYPESPNNGYGHGIIDAFAAVTTVADGLGTIEGFVTMDGEDTEEPVYDHTPPSGMIAGKGVQLSVHVSDNISITSVEVSYDGTTLEAEQVSGNHRSGEFEVTVPADDISGESFTYHWIINDYGGNEVTTESYTVELTEPLFFEDFTTNPEWEVFEGGDPSSWEWGEPTSGPESALTGTNVYATNLSGDYSSNEYSWLDMPVITLPEGDAAIEFQHWYDIESGWDNAYIAVTNDPTGQYQVLETFTGASDGWVTSTYDLSEFSGDDVYISFIMESDFSVNYPGWYIDNVMIVDLALADASSTDLAQNQLAESSGVPLDATVSVQETGRSVNTNPLDGSYSMLHESGSFTVVAEAYGFASEEQTVDLEEEGIANANFVLEELPKSTVSGTVTSANSGNPIADATLLLVEDANVDPVTTDENGQYDLTAYDGDYTVRVVAQGFHSKEVELQLDADVNLDIELEPFFTVPGDEIGYDDGTAENARAFYDAGNGWAVKMSLAEGQESAIVTDGVFQFHDADWPSPGDTPFAVEVWSAGDDGMPDEKLAGPIEADAVRDLNEWTVVDLRDENIQVEGDFFMVYLQTQANPYVPGLATDEDGPFAERSYEYVGGAWGQSPADEGNYMIRARVDYALGAPVITSPEDGQLTNEANVTVEGSAAPSVDIHLNHNGEEIDSMEVDESGEFSFDVELSEGQNELQAITFVNGERATQSDVVTITLDTVAPELNVLSPVDGDTVNQEIITVEGTASDDHLETVAVNGDETEVQEDGSFSTSVILDEGENTIEVVASDAAGNMAEEVITVHANFDAPVIENVQPAEDVTLQTGDTLQVAFDSATGLDAEFSILMPQENAMANVVDLPMTEESEGHYVGTYTVAEDVIADGAVVRVKATDSSGNESVEYADGKLYINVETDPGDPGEPGEPDPTPDRIKGDDRYDTAIEISQAGWDSSEIVILARGDDYADALAGVPLAHHYDAPILLTRTDELLDRTMDEIERLGATDIILLGGTEAVDSSIANKLSDMNLTVSRLSGDTRYDTAAEIAKTLAPDGTDQVVVASGQNFPDALSVASYAARAGLPILLTRADEIPAATGQAITELGVTETIAVGGTQVISEEVFNELPSAERLSGPDRYATNIAIAEGFGADSDHMYVATGREYADALTGAVLAAKENTSVLLVKDEVPGVVADYITSQGLEDLTIFGGTVAVSDDVKDALFELLQ